jgi:hypothetical protein
MQESATPSFLDRRAPDAPGGATAREAAPRQPDPTPIRAVGAPATNPTPATRALYAGDWAHFAAWCRQQRRTALPASADTLASYLLDVAPRLSRGSLGRRRAAVGAMHRQAGLPTPLLDGTVHASLRQTAKPKPLRSTPTAASLVRIAQTCPRDLPGRATAPCFCWPPRQRQNAHPPAGEPPAGSRAEARRGGPSRAGRHHQNSFCWGSMPSTSPSPPPGSVSAWGPARTRQSRAAA